MRGLQRRARHAGPADRPAASRGGARAASVDDRDGARRHLLAGYIEEQAERRGIGNLRLVTADMNDFDTRERFDRVVSVEMFEHMRNHRELLGRIARWLEPHGRLFVHIFCHRDVPYAFVPRDESDWMSRHFFYGTNLDVTIAFSPGRAAGWSCRSPAGDGVHVTR